MMQDINYKKQNDFLSKIAMLLLSLYPILHSYSTSFNIRYSELVFLFLTLIVLYHRGTKAFFFPKYYFVFWSYVAISLLFINANGLRITYLIPGGIWFFLFSLSIGVASEYFDIKLFYKIFRILFLISAIVFFAQFMQLLPTQYNTCAIFPISHHVAYTGVDYSSLIEIREYTSRQSSLFLEPAYFAIYCCIFLILELFYKGKDVLYTPFSLLVILTIIGIRSGTGLLGLALIFFAKVFTLWRNNRKYRFKLLLAIMFGICCVIYYIGTEIGNKMIERSAEFAEEGSSGYLRVIMGFLMYEKLPLFHKFVGIDTPQLLNYTKDLLIYDQNGEVIFFTNGFFTILIKNGLIGLLLLVAVYISLYRKTPTIGKVSLCYLLFISFIEQVYLLYPMLLCSVIANHRLKVPHELSNSR